jgi:DNA-binding NtrC family response regulator
MNIMIIDDDEGCLRALALFLKYEGHNCLSFTKPEVAVEKYKSKPCQVVITDLHMPSMNGFQVLQEIMYFNPEAKVIVITGCSDPETAGRVFIMGAHALFFKPLRFEELIEEIKAMDKSLPQKDPENFIK